MEIRLAEPDDASALALLRVRTWQEAYPGQISQAYLDGLDAQVDEQAERWRATLEGDPRPDLYVVGSEPSGELAGWILVSEERDQWPSPHVGEVQAIYIRRREWGSGLGRALWRVGTERLIQAGFTEAVVWVLDTNARARRFYERQGCVADGAAKDAEFGGVTVHEMRYRTKLTTVR